MIDLHLHLLPAVDDGPPDVRAIAERTRALQQAIDAAGIDLRLHPGGEIFPDGARDLGRAEAATGRRRWRRRSASCATGWPT